MSALIAYYRAEPARCNAWLAGVVVWLAVKVGLNVDHSTVVAFVGLAVPAVVGELTRAKVTPAKSENRKPL